METVKWKHKIECTETVESLRPCIVCLEPTRHRHKVVRTDWNSGGSTAPVCPKCCKEDIKPRTLAPSIRSRYMVKRLHCLKCGFMGPERRFKIFQASPWLTCPNCKVRKHKDAQDRHKVFSRIYTVPREFKEGQ